MDRFFKPCYNAFVGDLYGRYIVKSFWAGFEKRAKDPLKKWEEESEEEPVDKDKKQKQRPPDPVTASSSYTPDTYWRSWP